MRMGRMICAVLFAIAVTIVVGCGTTRTTDTVRAASEMLLVSQAVDTAVSQLDFSPLASKTVFLDVQYLDGTVDKGYVISSLRQHLLASGALLQEDRKSAQYVVEPRSGGVGTDRHGLRVGTPAMSLPPILPGVPTSIPEIALIKKTHQKGVAKLSVFAYNRTTGRALWQSGLVEADSSLKDTWVFGAGPISRGSIRRRMQLAGTELPTLPTLPTSFTQKEETGETIPHAVPVPDTEPHVWTNADQPPPPRPIPFALLGLTGPAAAIDRQFLPGTLIPFVPAAAVAPPAPSGAPIAPAGGLIQPPAAPLTIPN
jgi:hypothetical protein